MVAGHELTLRHIIMRPSMRDASIIVLLQSLSSVVKLPHLLSAPHHFAIRNA
jgi:hypothetical protein